MPGGWSHHGGRPLRRDALLCGPKSRPTAIPLYDRWRRTPTRRRPSFGLSLALFGNGKSHAFHLFEDSTERVAPPISGHTEWTASTACNRIVERAARLA